MGMFVHVCVFACAHARVRPLVRTSVSPCACLNFVHTLLIGLPDSLLNGFPITQPRLGQIISRQQPRSPPQTHRSNSALLSEPLEYPIASSVYTREGTLLSVARTAPARVDGLDNLSLWCSFPYFLCLFFFFCVCVLLLLLLFFFFPDRRENDIFYNGGQKRE